MKAVCVVRTAKPSRRIALSNTRKGAWLCRGTLSSVHQESDVNKAQEEFNNYQRGLGTDLAPNWRELARMDSKPVSEYLTQERSPNLGSAKIPPERYTSYEFHRREVEKIWKRTWQVVCREDEIPNIGDHFVYGIADLSFLVVRSGPAEFKAYWNICLHRGRRLVDKNGTGAKHFRCGYHAWTWSLNGELTYYPGAWDFPDVEKEKYALREVQVGTWGGFVFINPDTKGTSLAEHLGSLPKHFEHWPLDKRFSLWHVKKTINANWKVTMEAFLESYHVIQTHSMILGYTAEHTTQYDVYEEQSANFSRLITPFGTPSVHARDASSLSAIAGGWGVINGFRMDQPDTLPPEIRDRASLAAWRRKSLTEMTKADYSSLPDVEMLDAIQYHVFPNFCPWLGEGLPLSYQFRPNSDSPDTCYMDVWMLVRCPDEGDRPPAPQTIVLGPDQPFEPHIGVMGTVFDQDDFNMPNVQIGLKYWPGEPEGLTLARYQEIRIRFFHQALMKALNQP